MADKVDRTIRGLDAEVYKQTKAEAARQGRPIGDLVNEALIEKLEKLNQGRKTKH